MIRVNGNLLSNYSFMVVDRVWGGEGKSSYINKIHGLPELCNSESSVLRVRPLVVIMQFGPDVMGHFKQI